MIADKILLNQNNFYWIRNMKNIIHLQIIRLCYLQININNFLNISVFQIH